jgi:hypothetical protein
MRKLFFLFAATIISLNLLSQGLIGTSTSLIIVYNNPDNNFYIQLDGVDKKKTEQPTVFILDNNLVQVLALSKSKFLPDNFKSKSQTDIIKAYIKWESDYIKESYKWDVNIKTENLKTRSNKEVVFWAYDMPTGEEIVTDSTKTTPTQTQMFILRIVKDYIVGINTPLFDADQYEKNKTYLIKNIDNIVTSEKEIDIEELNQKVNKQ